MLLLPRANGGLANWGIIEASKRFALFYLTNGPEKAKLKCNVNERLEDVQ